MKLSDRFYRDPTIDRLSSDAYRLHVNGMNYAADLLTDGHVDADMVPRVVPKYRPRSLAELVDANLWTRQPDGGYLIHPVPGVTFVEWNKDREWWDARRAADAKRQQRKRHGDTS
jgi:hypothetical protein